MQVEPTRLVELAESCEAVLTTMGQDWQRVLGDLSGACDALGDATGTTTVASAYAESLADAGEVVTALAGALQLGVTGLVDAAKDALDTDDTVAAELARATHLVADDGFGRLPGPGGR